MAAPSLAGVNWQDVKSAVESGVTLQEAAAKYGIEFRTVQKRSQREQWLTPAAIIKRAKEITSQNVSVPSKAIQIAAETLVEKQELHKQTVERITSLLLKRAVSDVEKGKLSVADVADLEKTVKIARVNLDLTTGEAAPVVQMLFAGSENTAALSPGDIETDGETFDADAELVE